MKVNYELGAPDVEQPLRRKLAWTVAAALLILLVGGIMAMVTVDRRSTQLRNLEEMRGYVGAVDEFRHQRGHYPQSLRDAVMSSSIRPAVRQRLAEGHDLWRHPVAYRSDGTTFLLVSYGRDGRPDGTDYLAAARSKLHLPCESVDSDQFFSNFGEHRTCGK
ncbi:MAG: type II secretion system protein GspG [Thermoanaerobaculia bacterium]